MIAPGNPVRAWLRLLLLGLAGAFPSLAFAQAAPDPAPPAAAPAPAAAATAAPVLEQFIYSGQSREYTREALAWVQRNPNAPQSPRLVHDLLMLAVLARNEEGAEEMRRVLLFNYPRSLHAQYVAASFKDLDDARRFVIRAGERDMRIRPESAGERFCAAMRAILTRTGGDLLANHEVLLLTSAMAEVGGDKELRDLAARAAAQMPARSPDLETLWAVVSPAGSGEAKLAALLPLLGDRRARMLAAAYLSGLKAEARGGEAVSRVMAALHLLEGRFPEALAAMEQVPAATRLPRDRFWRGWALASAGRLEDAAAELDALIQAAPDDPWAGVAREYRGQMNDAAARLPAHVQGVQTVIEQLQPGVDVLEATIAVDRGEGKPLRVYLGLTAGDAAQVQAWRGEELILAFRTGPEGSALYNPESKTIQTFKEAAPMPMLNLRVLGTPESGYSINTSFTLADRNRAAAGLLADLLASPALAGEAAIRDWLAAQVQRGALPLAVQPAGEAQVYRWLKPDVLKPQTATLAVTVAKDGRITAIQTGGVRVEGLRYGPRAALTLQPPAWPDAPSADAGRFNPAVLLRGFADLFTGIINTANP